MKEILNRNSGVDWAIVVSLLFWIVVIASFIILISLGQTRIPHAAMEVIEASASRENLTIAHRNGDPVRFANTKCIWTSDMSFPNVTGDAGSLVLVGKENKQGIVSKLEPGEMAKLEKDIKMKSGSVGRIIIEDLISGQQIFTQTVRITN